MEKLKNFLDFLSLPLLCATVVALVVSIVFYFINWDDGTEAVILSVAFGILAGIETARKQKR